MKRRAVFIQWRDACDRGNGDWTPNDGEPGALITTVAILVKKSRHYYTVCQSFDDNDEPLQRNVFDIVRTSVVEMYELDRK